MENNHKIQLLDCTFRDGGQGLQASYLYGLKGASFSGDIISRGIRHLSESACDIIEIGYMDDKLEKMAGYASYSDIAMVSKNIPVNTNGKDKGQMYIALFTGPDAPPETIPECSENMVGGVRVILRYSELERSLDFCELLVQKGYKVFVQPMLTMRYTDEDLDLCIERANRMHAYALYFVDSFGYMDEKDVIRLYDYYESRLDPDIKIGFHAHNNLNLAYSNAKRFIEHAIHSDRNIIIDSTCTGIGQGAGNLQSELIVPFLNDNYGKRYDYNQFLEVCELIEPLTNVNQWGYSVMWALPAVYKAAYKYALVMREKLGFSYMQMNDIFSIMPQDFKHRYTRDNLMKLFEMQGITVDQNSF